MDTLKELYLLIAEHPWITLFFTYIILIIIEILLKYIVYLIQVLRQGYTEDSLLYAEKHICPNCKYKNNYNA